jgi:hypothetical protein
VAEKSSNAVSAGDDFPGEMDTFPFDGNDADAVFGVSPGSNSVPEELRDVADLVLAARHAGSTEELAGEDVIVAQIAAAIGEHLASATGDAHERTRVLSKFRTAKVAAAATAVLVMGATAAAATTGSLPAPVQSTVASGLSGVGINLPTHHHIALAAEHVAAPAHTKGHHQRKPVPGAAGLVASVNGVSTAGTCGVSGSAGTFTLTGRKGATFTVNVATSTTFLDEGVTGPSFANVCVGAVARAKGTVADMTVTATKVLVTLPRPPRPPHVPTGAAGTVASVNGVTTAGTCGVAGSAGAFTLTVRKGATFTVNVATSTTFLDKGVTGPSFANVCVGGAAFAQGTVTDMTVTAASVLIAPMKHEQTHHHGVFGTVASVNGVTTAGTCGAATTSGSFVVTGFKGATITVNVDGSTKFFTPGVSDASFANVCVGAKVGASGDTSGSSLTATSVFVLPAHMGDHHDGDHGKGAGHFPFGFGHQGAKPAGTDDAGSGHAGSGHAGSGHAQADETGTQHKGTGSHGNRNSGTKHGH